MNLASMHLFGSKDVKRERGREREIYIYIQYMIYGPQFPGISWDIYEGNFVALCLWTRGLLDHFFGTRTDLISKNDRFLITETAKLADENRNPQATQAFNGSTSQIVEHGSDPVCKEVAHSILHTSLNPALLARYKESCL